MSGPPRQATAYARVSTEDQADEGLGITAQIDVATAAIAERDWVLVAEVVDAGVSGSVALERRPALGPALEALDGAGAGAALVVARLDRVTRSLLAWAELVERSRRRGWAIVVVAEGFDLSTDSGELTAALLASVAQYERRLSGARTREAMAAGKARGARYGRPIEHAPEARHIVGDMRAGAATLQAIADRLTAEGISIPRGGPWRTSNVDGILRSLRLDAKPPRRRRHDRPLGRLQPSRSWATRSPRRRRERSTRRPVAGRERLRGGDRRTVTRRPTTPTPSRCPSR